MRGPFGSAGETVDRAERSGEVAVGRDPLVGEAGARFGALGMTAHGERRDAGLHRHG